MSKKANPVAIGSFVIGAIGLIVVGVLVFSSGKLFTKTHTLVTVFPGTVKGLKVGNPVEFRGVRIGSVKDIKILYDKKGLTVAIPVYLELVQGTMMGVDLKKLDQTETPEEWMAEIDRLVKAGLRAQMDLQSLVTGQMIVVLDFHPDTPAKLTGIDARYAEIPSIASSMERIAGRLKKIPMEELAQKAIAVLDGIDALVRSQQVKDMLENADLATQDTRRLVKGISEQVQPLSDSIRAALDEVRQSIDSMKTQLNQALGDISGLSQDAQQKLDVLSKPAVEALSEAKAAMKSLDDLVGKDSATRGDLENTLQELALAARSLRILADYLEQRPDALIKGKGY